MRQLDCPCGSTRKSVNGQHPSVCHGRAQPHRHAAATASSHTHMHAHTSRHGTGRTTLPHASAPCHVRTTVMAHARRSKHGTMLQVPYYGRSELLSVLSVALLSTRSRGAARSRVAVCCHVSVSLAPSSEPAVGCVRCEAVSCDSDWSASSSLSLSHPSTSASSSAHAYTRTQSISIRTVVCGKLPVVHHDAPQMATFMIR